MELYTVYGATIAGPLDDVLREVVPYFSWKYGQKVLVLVAIVWAVRWFLARSRAGGDGFVASLMGKLFGQGFENSQLRREAARAERARDWFGAGQLWDELGNLDKALDCYEKGEEYRMCGEICLRMGRKDYAADWFVLGNEKVRAARLFAEAGKLERAAEIYLDAGSALEAAAMFGKAGNFERAGELYTRGGYYLKAGVAYESAGDFRRAAELFERQLGEVSAGAQGYLSEKQRQELARLSARAASGFQKVGERKRAASIMERGGQYGLAAAVWEKLGEHKQAAELYRKAGQMHKAAEMFGEVGDSRTAASLEGEHQLSLGNQPVAAECFLKAGDPIRAAELFEVLNQYARAADCYENAGAFAAAADAALLGGDKSRGAGFLEKAKQFDRAAELRMELGNFEQAAKFFAEAGRFFEAAKAASKAKLEKDMVGYLQQVPPEDTHYTDATAHLGKLFLRRGWTSLAIEKLQRVVGDADVRADNLHLWDVLAQAYEAQEDFQKTADILHRIMAVQYNYEGADQRHTRALEQIAAEKSREIELESQATAVGGNANGNGHRYELQKLLGKGGMGAVYLAFDSLLKRPVAYKVLSAELARSADARDQLLAEARAAAALNHPNIITVFDIGFKDDQPFICMELVEGENYAKILRGKKHLAIPDAMHLLVSVCQGLEHAHRRGIVHRDLKPSNVLLTTENRVKIVDFGLAQLNHGDEVVDGNMSISGTPKYVSPEQARAQQTDARSDIYSLGAALYEILVGHAPFTEGNLVMHHLYTPVPPLRKIRPEIPEPLEELVLHCLAKQPQERFQSTGEILAFAQAAKLL